MENSNNQQREDVCFMEEALRQLKATPCQNRDKDYKTIIELMNNYIQTHCNHKVVTDLIDIDPDRSKMVQYCELCYKTFN
jgi:hypothetical protein